MLFKSNLKMALNSLKSSKWRSFLTMLGIIIGVASVVTTVSLGEGVKKQVSQQIHRFGTDLITVRPGAPLSRDATGDVVNVNFLSRITTATFNDSDVKTVAHVKDVKVSAPLALVNGLPTYEKRHYSEGVVLGTGHTLPQLLNQEIKYGAFFTVGEEGRKVAVLGKTAAEKLFRENVPIGKSFTLRNEEFIVRGVFDEFEGTPFSPGGDFNRAIFIPYTTGKDINEGNTPVFEILAKPTSDKTLSTVSADIHSALKASHGGQEDFMVLGSEDSVTSADETLTMLTGMVASIAAISLLVGGIGVMNIMLVSVTERMHEIGIRKAVGATNRQILSQFLIEAVVLSLAGSFIGVIVALLCSYLFRVFTTLEPVLDPMIAVISTGVALAVGVIFGTAPALKAARKDPIDALRHE